MFTDQSFVEESLNYYSRHYQKDMGIDFKTQHPDPRLVNIITESGLDVTGMNVLEVGCGGGRNLLWFKKMDCKCSGIEPNPDVVKMLSKNFPEMEFKLGTADSLPFDTNMFDLVFTRNVLCWVDRNFILQALGEIIRTSCSWIIISEFCGSKPYRTPYKHSEGLFTYHTDYINSLIGTGIVELLYERIVYYNPSESQDVMPLNKEQFLSGKYDKWAVKNILLKKNVNCIPCELL